MAVGFSLAGDTLRPALPEKLFGFAGYGSTYQVAPDGNRFFTDKDADTGAALQPIVVINWFDDLESKVPAP